MDPFLSMASELTQRAWDDLINKGDRTSPPEYPDMTLITSEELAGYMAMAIEFVLDMRKLNNVLDQ
jgi:hypothetical protein